MSEFRAHFSDCSRGIDAGAFALDALSPEETASFDAHLGECVLCRAEVSSLRLVVDQLPLAAPQASPPAALKGRLMAVVESEAALLRAAGPEADRAPAPRRSRRWIPTFDFSLRPAFAGALACGMLGLGVAGGLVVSGTGEPETVSRSAWAKGAAQARLTQTGDRASLEVSEMPSLERGQVYQVWFEDAGGQLRPSHTLFNVRSDGRAKIAIEESVAGVQRVLVTAEKTGGALAPSPAGPVITATLS